MIADLGHVLLWIALTVNLGSAVVPFIKRISTRNYIEYATYTMALAITVSFACLIAVHVISDFSVVHVMKYSHQLKPMLYKVTGVWGNHEGSMLLWLWVLSLYGATFAYSKKVPAQGKIKALFIMHGVTIGFTLFILLTSNPFIRIAGAVAAEGLGLNPLLQDIGLAIHPPTLYIGYVGAAMLFAIMASILWEGDFTKEWAVATKPFLMVAWSGLTCGILLGSWWAYRELGWGGFWFWDPVENVSLIPWLSMTAMLHSLLIVEKRGYLKGWTVFLGIITFGYSIIGAFLVRSGILTSVHAFAEDSSRGIFILLLFIVWLGAGFMLFIARGHKLYKQPDFMLGSREGLILINNILLVILSLVVLLGTIYPILLELITGHKVTVGSPYYVISFNSIAVWLLGLAVIAPYTKWKKDNILEGNNNQLLLMVISVLYGGLIWWYYPEKFWVIYVAVSLSIWLLLSMGSLWVKRTKPKEYNIYKWWQNIRKTPAPFHAMILAHCGIAICVLGITFASGWKQEKEAMMRIGDTIELANITATLEHVQNIAENNYIARKAHIRIAENKGNKELALLKPELRFYPVEQQQTTESSVRTTIGHDIYAIIGEYDMKEKSYAIRIYIEPMISWIWFGGALMVVAGLISWKGVKRND